MNGLLAKNAKENLRNSKSLREGYLNIKTKSSLRLFFIFLFVIV